MCVLTEYYKKKIVVSETDDEEFVFAEAWKTLNNILATMTPVWGDKHKSTLAGRPNTNPEKHTWTSGVSKRFYLYSSETKNQTKQNTVLSGQLTSFLQPLFFLCKILLFSVLAPPLI